LDWEAHVKIDPKYFRPTEVEFLLADASKAKKRLNWEPKVTFKSLVKIMVDADLNAIKEMKQCQDIVKTIIADKR